jgi:cytochrome P450 PksS
MELAGTRIARGEIVLGSIAAANRDPAAFPDPDRLDLARTPNRHLAFGGGHSCIGAPLARLEGAVGIATLLRRLPRLRLAVPEERLPWRPGLVLRGLEALPVTPG